MDIGYAQVSTTKQEPDRQIDALRKEGIAAQRIFTDKKSGANTNRPVLHAALEQARDGDVIVVHTLDRIGQNLAGPPITRVQLGLSLDPPIIVLATVELTAKR